jgi:hypothetical protein
MESVKCEICGTDAECEVKSRADAKRWKSAELAGWQPLCLLCADAHPWWDGIRRVGGDPRCEQ